MKRYFVGAALTCPTCGRRCYLTRKDARVVRRRIHKGDELQVVQCGDYWHLTSKR